MIPTEIEKTEDLPGIYSTLSYFPTETKEYYDLRTTKTHKLCWVEVYFEGDEARAGAYYSTSIESGWDFPLEWDHYSDFNRHDWVLVPYNGLGGPKQYGKLISKCKVSVTLSFNGSIGIYRRDRESEWSWIEKSK